MVATYTGQKHRRISDHIKRAVELGREVQQTHDGFWVGTISVENCTVQILYIGDYAIVLSLNINPESHPELSEINSSVSISAMGYIRDGHCDAYEVNNRETPNLHVDLSVILEIYNILEIQKVRLILISRGSAPIAYSRLNMFLWNFTFDEEYTSKIEIELRGKAKVDETGINANDAFLGDDFYWSEGCKLKNYLKTPAIPSIICDIQCEISTDSEDVFFPNPCSSQLGFAKSLFHGGFITYGGCGEEIVKNSHSFITNDASDECLFSALNDDYLYDGPDTYYVVISRSFDDAVAGAEYGANCLYSDTNDLFDLTRYHTFADGLESDFTFDGSGADYTTIGNSFDDGLGNDIACGSAGNDVLMDAFEDAFLFDISGLYDVLMINSVDCAIAESDYLANGLCDGDLFDLTLTGGFRSDVLDDGPDSSSDIIMDIIIVSCCDDGVIGTAYRDVDLCRVMYELFDLTWIDIDSSNKGDDYSDLSASYLEALGRLWNVTTSMVSGVNDVIADSDYCANGLYDGEGDLVDFTRDDVLAGGARDAFSYYIPDTDYMVIGRGFDYATTGTEYSTNGLHNGAGEDFGVRWVKVNSDSKGTDLPNYSSSDFVDGIVLVSNLGSASFGGGTGVDCRAYLIDGLSERLVTMVNTNGNVNSMYL